MSRSAFISSVNYFESADMIIADIVNAALNPIAKLTVTFEEARQIRTHLRVIDADAVTALPYVNDVVFTAAIIATLDRHTTDETDIPLVIDILDPVEIAL